MRSLRSRRRAARPGIRWRRAIRDGRNGWSRAEAEPGSGGGDRDAARAGDRRRSALPLPRRREDAEGRDRGRAGRHHAPDRLLLDGLRAGRRADRGRALAALGAGDRDPPGRREVRADRPGPRRDPRGDARARDRAGRRSRVQRRERDRLRLPHPFRAGRDVQLPDLQHGLHVGELADRLPDRRRLRPQALLVHDGPAGDGDPPRRPRPRPGPDRLGRQLAARRDREPLARGAPPRSRRVP